MRTSITKRSIVGQGTTRGLLGCFLVALVVSGCSCEKEPGVENLPCGPDGTCENGLVCIDEICVPDPCLEMECEGGEVCVLGSCVPESCEDRKCPDGLVCIDGDCVSPSCANIDCDEGYLCADGRCYPTDCAGIDCGAGVCLDGECVPRSCVGVSCPEGYACALGECHPVDCAMACAPGEVCVEGECVEASCVGVNCPEGQDCKGGACVEPMACELPWGGSIENDESVTAYEQEQVACGETCVSEIRQCVHGSLTGSYTHELCAEGPCAGCEAGLRSWGEYGCAAELHAAEHGESLSVGNMLDGRTGSATWACSDGTWKLQDGSLCEPAADPGISTMLASPSSVVADGVSTSIIMVQLKDGLGNNLAEGGDTVCLQATAGTLSGEQAGCADGHVEAADNDDGTHSATLTSSTDATETAVVTGTLNGAEMTDVAIVDFVPGEAVRLLFVSSDADLASGDTRDLIVEVLDAAGNLLVDDNGRTVTFAKVDGSGDGAVMGLGPAFTEAGVASLPVTGEIDGDLTIEATSGDLEPDTTTFTVFTLGSPVQNTGGNSGHYAVATFPQQPTEGNLLVAVSVHRVSWGVPHINGHGGSDWIHVATVLADLYDPQRRRAMAIWHKIAGDDEPLTVETHWDDGEGPVEPNRRNFLIVQEYYGAFELAGSAANYDLGEDPVSSLETGAAEAFVEGSLLVGAFGARWETSPPSWSLALDGVDQGSGLESDIHYISSYAENPPMTMQLAHGQASDTGYWNATAHWEPEQHAIAALVVFSPSAQGD